MKPSPEGVLEHIGRLAVAAVLANRRLKEEGVCEMDPEEDEDTGRVYRPNCRTSPRSIGELGTTEKQDWCPSCVAALALVTARRRARNALSAAISRYLKRTQPLPSPEAVAPKISSPIFNHPTTRPADTGSEGLPADLAAASGEGRGR